MEEPRHHRRPDRQDGDATLKVRNILNIIFMIAAGAGVALYFYGNRQTGTIVILAAIVVKIIECCIRFLNR